MKASELPDGKFVYGRAVYEGPYHRDSLKLDRRDPEEVLAEWEERGYRQRLRDVWAGMPKAIGGRVLEVACHHGKSAFWMLEDFPRIEQMHMFDFSRVAIEHCKRYEKHRAKTTIWCGDVTDIWTRDEYYDWITCLDVTEHLPPKVYKAMLRELWRVCKPNRYLVLMSGSDQQCVEHINLMRDRDLLADFVAIGWRHIASMAHRHYLLHKGK